MQDIKVVITEKHEFDLRDESILNAFFLENSVHQNSFVKNEIRNILTTWFVANWSFEIGALTEEIKPVFTRKLVQNST